MAKTLDEAGVKRLIQEIKGANKNLNTPIPISTENTTESKAQNVKNIADYVEKAKAAGIADVNGMAVTCLIDGENSGVGYLYVTNTQVLICGILPYEDSSVSCITVIDGTYGESSIVVERQIGQVTSDMLVEGARKPIILTPNTTEVDGETYQKLLSDDVDVIFKTSIDDANLCTLTYKVDDGNFWSLYFTCFSIEGEALGNIYFYAYEVAIEKNAPHTCTINVLKEGETLDDAIESYDYIKKAILSPVLQEIDLRGTDAERKAKLDQFETDWKALTGADDLTGARFVGKFGITDDVERIVNGIMTYCPGDGPLEKNDNCFYGICNGYSYSEQKSQIAVKVSCTDGSITITPLFSHLEAITIKIGNTPEGKAANVAAIKAYVDNLTALGVDVTKGYMIPVKLNNGYHGFIMGTGADGNHTGIIKRNTYNYGGGWIFIDNIGTYQYLECLTLGSYDNLTTTAKTIVPAINEVNALAEGYSTIFTPIELTTDPAQNKTTIDARVAAFTAQGISLTNGCCIPVTYKGVYAGNISLINGDWYGLLVKNTNNPADNINIKLSADGTITEGNSAQ